MRFCKSCGNDLDQRTAGCHACSARHSRRRKTTHLPSVPRQELASIALKNALKTHCVHGHEFTPENTGHRGSTRYCIACSKVIKYQNAKKRRARTGTTIHDLARNSVARAVRSGKLVRPDRCEKCGRESKHIHGHHEDYSRRLDVVWLCAKCHHDLHVALEATQEKAQSA